MLYIAAKIVPGGLGLLTTACLTRLLSPADYGQYGLALVIMGFGSTLMFDWLGVSYVRFHQARRDDPLLQPTFLGLFAGLAALTAAGAALAWALGLGAGEGETWIVGLLLILSYSWFEFSAHVEVAGFRPLTYMTMNFVRAALIFITVAGGAWLFRDPLLAALGLIVGTAGGACAGRTGWRGLRPRMFDRRLAYEIVAFGLPLAASMGLGSVVSTGTRAVLAYLGSTEALGIYTAVYLLVQTTLNILAAGIESAGYSMAVQAVEGGDAMVARRQLEANGALLLTILTPAALGLSLCAGAIASTLVGADFAPGVQLLTPWIAAATFFSGVRAFYFDKSFQLGLRPQLQIWITGVAALVTLGASVLLIPSDGAEGAAIAVCLGMAVGCVAAWICGRWAFRLPLPVSAAARVAGCCAGMAGVVVCLPDTGWSALALRVGIGGLVYTALGIAFDLLGARRRLMVMLRRG